MATSQGLVALNRQGRRILQISDEPLSWCQVDNRALVVWAASMPQNGQVTLFAYDLAEKGRQILSVGPMRMPEAWQLQAGAERLSTQPKSRYQVGVTIDVQSPGGLRGHLGCKGAAKDCLANRNALSPTVKAWQNNYALLRLPKTIREKLALRGANRRFVGPERKAAFPKQFPRAGYLWLRPQGNDYIVGGELRSGRGRLLFKGQLGCGWTGPATLVRRRQ